MKPNQALLTQFQKSTLSVIKEVVAEDGVGAAVVGVETPMETLVVQAQTLPLQGRDTGELNIRIFRLGTGRGVAYISDGGGALISVLNLRHVHGKTFSFQSHRNEGPTSSATKLTELICVILY